MILKTYTHSEDGFIVHHTEDRVSTLAEAVEIVLSLGTPATEAVVLNVSDLEYMYDGIEPVVLAEIDPMTGETTIDPVEWDRWENRKLNRL